MKKNMGSADRTIRLVLAVVFVFLYGAKIVTGGFGIALLVIGIIFIVTSLVNFCPLYTLLGINTCAAKK